MSFKHRVIPVCAYRSHGLNSDGLFPITKASNLLIDIHGCLKLVDGTPLILENVGSCIWPLVTFSLI